MAVDIDRGFWTIAIAPTTLTACFVTVVVQSRLLSFDRSRRAAVDLGCPPWRTFSDRDIAFDCAGAVRGLDAGVHAVARRPRDRELHHRSRSDTLPIRIYSEIRLGVKPEINAVCTIVVALVGLGIVAASLLVKFHEAARLTAKT